MRVDDNELQIEVLRLFREGRGREASRLQDRFLEELAASGQDHCTCPTPCKFHGRCYECVVTHRGHGDHLPHCFETMVNRRLTHLSGLTEHSFVAPPAPSYKKRGTRREGEGGPP